MVTHARALRALLPLVAALLGAAAPAAFADARTSARERFLVTVEVIDSRPVHAPATVTETRLECRDRGRRGPRATVYGARPGERDGVRRDGRRVATAVGGLVGGAVGHRLARDGSRAARAGATVAGALIGSAAGRGLAHSGHGYDRGYDRGYGHDRGYGYGRDRLYGHRYGRGYGVGHGRDRAAERCVRVVETRRISRLDHYEVTYALRGRTLRARRDRAPGATIEIDVSRPPAHR